MLSSKQIFNSKNTHCKSMLHISYPYPTPHHPVVKPLPLSFLILLSFYSKLIFSVIK